MPEAAALGWLSATIFYGNNFDIKGWCNAYGAYPQILDRRRKRASWFYGSTTPEMKEALGSLAELFQEG